MTLSRLGGRLVLLAVGLPVLGLPVLAGCSGDATVEQMMDTMQRVTKLEARADQTTADVNALKAATARPAAAQPIPPAPVMAPAAPAAPTPAMPAPTMPAPPAAGAPVPIVPPAPAPAPAAAAMPPAAATPPASELRFAVHLASYKQEAEATKGWSQLQAKYAVLKPLQARLSRVDLGPKGIYYRLKAGPLADQKAAEALCRQLKGAGVGYCNPEGFEGKPLGS